MIIDNYTTDHSQHLHTTRPSHFSHRPRISLFLSLSQRTTVLHQNSTSRILMQFAIKSFNSRRQDLNVVSGR